LFMVQRCKFSIELKNFPPDLSGEPKTTNGCFLIKVFKVPEYTNSGYFGTKKHTDWSD
jgi:hypothetical protein